MFISPSTETSGRISSKALELIFQEHLEDFLRDWGPVQWRTQAAAIPPADRPDLALLLHGLSGIEDDAFYMQKKLRHSGAARMQSIKHFNSVWLVEEAEHARALAALSERFGGGAVARGKHSTFKRDKRSILAVPSLSVSSLYGRGITAAYMTLGVLVEYIAITTYNAIPKVFPCEPMADVLRQMSRQEGRHLRFYRSGATALLQDDRTAQCRAYGLLSRATGATSRRTCRLVAPPPALSSEQTPPAEHDYYAAHNREPPEKPCRFTWTVWPQARSL